MNNIKYSNLEFYNKIKYFLFHWFLISCIKNILEIPNILNNFSFSFKASYKTFQVLI